MAWYNSSQLPSGYSYPSSQTAGTTINYNHWTATIRYYVTRVGSKVYMKATVTFTKGSYGDYYPYSYYNFYRTNSDKSSKFTAGSAGTTQTRYAMWTNTGTNQSFVFYLHGWTSSEGDGLNDAHGVTVSFPNPTSYALRYVANGHGTAPGNQTKYKDETIKLQPFIVDQTVGGASTAVTVTGNANGGQWSGSNGSAGVILPVTVYHQTSWNTNSAGTGTAYGSQANYTANASATFWAAWSSSTCAARGTSYTLPTGTPSKSSVNNLNVTVTFDPNGGVTSKVTQNASQTTSYTFDGWYTAATGGTKRTTASRITAPETVYAHYNSSGGDAVVTLPSAVQCTRASYILAGWASTPDATTATWLPGSSYYPGGDDILYAVWQPMGLPIYTKVGNDIKQIMNVYTQVDETIYPAEVYVNNNGTIKKLE